MGSKVSVRLHALQSLNWRKNKIQNIVEALISSGHKSLDEQARALGLNRATAWTIRKNRHKLGRLSAKTIARIIANPNTPPLVLTAVYDYVLEGFDDQRDNQREQISNFVEIEN